MIFMKQRVGIGQDSHRFLKEGTSKPCILGGVIFEDEPGLKANSDGDVIFHAICNAISSVTGVIILGKIADEILKKDGITDSSVYLQEALKTLGKQSVTHVAITVEGSRPKLLPKIEQLRDSIANVMGLERSQVGITATSGEGLTAFGCGDGISAFCILSTQEH